MLLLLFWTSNYRLGQLKEKKIGKRSGTEEPGSVGGTRGPTHMWDAGHENRDPKGGTRYSRPGTQLRGGTWDPRPETRDRESGFSATFLSSLWNLAFMNGFIFALCVYIYFVYLSLLYHKEYTILIFYHLNELLFYSFFPCSCYEIFKFPTKPLIIAPYIEQWKRFKLMEIKKLSHNKESDPQRRL